MRMLSVPGLLLATMLHAQPVAPTIDQCMERTLHHMGAFHADSAMMWIGRGLALARQQGDTLAEYHFLTDRAEVLYYEGLFTPAWKDLDRSMALAGGLHDSLLVANVHNLRGLLHENIATNGSAITHFRRALAHYPVHGTARWPVTRPHHIHGNLANAHLQAGTPDSAQHHAERSLALAGADGDARAVALAQLALGRVALLRQDPAAALPPIQQAQRAATDSKDHDVVLDGIAFEAEAWKALGRPADARRALEGGQRLAREHHAVIGLSAMRDLHRRSAALYERLGDTAAALAAQRAWHRADSTIADGNLRTALATQAELIRTDAELALAKERTGEVAARLERERQLKLAWTTAAAILLLAFVVIYFINKEKRRQRERTAALEMEGLRREALITELRVREQVGRDMHDDMGAGLSALKLRSEMALRVEQDPQARAHLSDLANTAGELIGSMRQIIWAMNADQAGLDDLAVYTANHVRVQCDLHGLTPRVDIPLTWPAIQLTSQQRRNVFLVVKEALHNVVKHAGATEVHLVMRWADGLDMVLEDDGRGLPAGTEHSMGNGLRNMRRRITELGGRCTLGPRDHGTGTRLAVHIPLGPGRNEGSIATDVPVSELRRP